MRSHEFLDEYNIIQPPNYSTTSFSGSPNIGFFNSQNFGSLEVYQLDYQNTFYFAAVNPKIGPSKPMAYLGVRNFPYLPKYWLSKLAFVEAPFRNKGLMLDFFEFMNGIKPKPILSDHELTADGEMLWQRMIASGRFNIRLCTH